MNQTLGKRRRPRPLWLVAAALAATPLTFLGFAAWASTPKAEIERSLLALARNRRIRETGLSRLMVPMTSGGETRDVEVTFLRAGTKIPGRRTIVLVHGTPGSLTTWGKVIFGGEGLRGLAQDHDVVAIEVIGHGFSRSSWAPYSFQRCADFVAAAVRGLGLRDVCLVGQSYGGEFVWRAALDHPDLIGRVVLLDSSGHRRPEDGWMPEEVEIRRHPLARWGYLLNAPERLRTALVPQFRRAVTDEEVEEFFLVCDNADDWLAMMQIARDENGTREADIARIAQPTLLLWGAGDITYPPDRCARRFAADIPKSELHVVEGSGHYVQEEQPGEAARRISEFADRP